MTWQVVTTYNNVDNLAPMIQAPAMPGGLQYPELRHSANMAASWHGTLFCDLEWDVIKRLPVGETNSILEQLLTQFGLSQTDPTGPVTVQLRNNNGDWANYNATANLISMGERGQGWVERLVIRLVQLEVIAA